jgi:hypothetical protein
MALNEQGRGAAVNWRKNTRQVDELTPEGARQVFPGVDPNRNYGFEHIRIFDAAYRQAMPEGHQSANGLNDEGEFSPNSECYAGHVAFSDVEARAVAGLALSERVGCSLCWHSYSGYVLHPMGHETDDGLSALDRGVFNELAEAVALATGYENLQDTFPTRHYPVYGSSDDYLYKIGGVFALTVEAYSSVERNGTGPDFFPDTLAKQQAVEENNAIGGLALLDSWCGRGQPDVVVSRFEITGAATMRGDGFVEVPARATVRNQGTAPAVRFKISTEFTEPPNTYPLGVAFTVPGQSDIWYPWTSGPLASGAEETFEGVLQFSRGGRAVSVWARADSCSGDEFMPDWCRVAERNEGNNQSAAIPLVLP